MKQSVPIQKRNILFVCLGNICRSPIAEGVISHLARQRGLDGQLTVASAGLGSWHVGNPPDKRAQNAMSLRGIDISGIRARRVTPEDFERFDMILAMDRSNRDALLKMAPHEHRHKVALFMDYAPNLCVHEIPDPFFGDLDGFDYAYQLIEAACRGLLFSVTARASVDVQATPARSAESVNG
jgi:protein-tyrosine phosphatase